MVQLRNKSEDDFISLLYILFKTNKARSYILLKLVKDGPRTIKKLSEELGFSKAITKETLKGLLDVSAIKVTTPYGSKRMDINNLAYVDNQDIIDYIKCMWEGYIGIREGKYKDE